LNAKILELVTGKDPEALNPDNQVTCPKHVDKDVEYFCRQCSKTVCVKCIFDEHNGHDLIQIEEMSSSLK